MRVGFLLSLLCIAVTDGRQDAVADQVLTVKDSRLKQYLREGFGSKSARIEGREQERQREDPPPPAEGEGEGEAPPPEKKKQKEAAPEEKGGEKVEEEGGEKEAVPEEKVGEVQASVDAKVESVKIEKGSNSAKFRQSIVVEGSMTANAAEIATLKVTGSAEIDSLAAVSIEAPTITSKEIIATKISSPSGTIIIEGNLMLKSAGGKGEASFLQYSENSLDASAWVSVSTDDFNEMALGWSSNIRNSCSNGGGNDFFLVGSPCLASGTLVKVINTLPYHNKVRLTGRVHFIDAWRGESVYIKVEGEDGEVGSIVWMDSASAPSMDALKAGLAINACGGEHPDSRLSVPIDITFAHSSPSIRVTVSSTLSGEGACDAFFGIDDLAVYARKI